MFRVDDPHSEPRVLHELIQNSRRKRLQRDVSETEIKKNRPSWLVSKHCYDVDSSEAESSCEEDEKISASEEEAVTETENANEIQENVESSYPDHSSADEAKRRKSAETA